MIKVVTYLLLVFVLVGVCFGFVWLANMPVKHFVINGKYSSQEQKAIESSLSVLGPQFVLSADLDVIYNRLSELNWLHSLTVKRRWPDTIELSLNRTKPIARWGDANYYLAANAQVMQLPDQYHNLPHIVAKSATADESLKIFRLLDQMLSREKISVQKLLQDQHGEWQTHLLTPNNKEVKVLLGAQDVSARVHNFLLVYRRALKQQARVIAYVDARYGSGVAVKFEDTPLLASSEQVASELPSSSSPGLRN